MLLKHRTGAACRRAQTGMWEPVVYSLGAVLLAQLSTQTTRCSRHRQAQTAAWYVNQNGVIPIHAHLLCLLPLCVLTADTPVPEQHTIIRA
jgi:hypothetical protein